MPGFMGRLAMSVPRWYAVHTKPRSEDRVVFWLRQRTSLPVFLPKVETLRRWQGRRVRRIEPLFPSYLFVHVSTEAAHWGTVRWSPGVKRIVGTGEVPAPVPDEAVELLMARCTHGVIPWEPRLRSGCKVKITEGPFAGLTGILERPASRSERVRVLLDLLRTAVTVEVDVVDVEEVSA